MVCNLGTLGAEVGEVQRLSWGMDPTDAVKHGVREYHQHQLRNGGLMACQRKESNEAVACLQTPRHGVTALADWASI